MRSLFRCPLCGGPLEREAGALRCASGHSYDLAKEGYVHLLPPNQKRSSAPGDDKGMARARREFLSKEYYRPLLNTFCREISAVSGDSPLLLDAGCGEGYYTQGIYEALTDQGKRPQMAGTDISKSCLRLAAKRGPGVEYAVASSYRLPLTDGTFDGLLNCFSPLALEEFRRVLRPGGRFWYVVPGPDHLWEMKEVLYDRPYRNEDKETPYPGFAYEKILPVEGRVRLEGPEDIRNLFQMTPYFWKTPRSGVERLEALSALECRISFRIHCFQKRI